MDLKHFPKEMLRIFHWRQWIKNYGVLPVVVLGFTGAGLAISYSMHSLLTKSDVCLTKRPRFIDAKPNATYKLIDMRQPPTKFDVRTIPRSEEYFQIRKELDDVYYPSK